MEITRREFLGYSAGAISVMGLPLPHCTPAAVARKRAGLIIGIPGQCSLPESVLGFQAALDGERSAGMARLVIVPALLELPPDGATMLARFVRHGMTVIVESGAGFAGHLNYCQHRRSLREGLQILVAPPLDLWSQPRPGPYVDYKWPFTATVRDFSRAVPPAEQPGEIIAWAGDVAVAFKRRVSTGRLIYLGSPIGPALWAGDVEARRWLHAVALAA